MAKEPTPYDNTLEAAAKNDLTPESIDWFIAWLRRLWPYAENERQPDILDVTRDIARGG